MNDLSTMWSFLKEFFLSRFRKCQSSQDCWKWNENSAVICTSSYAGRIEKERRRPKNHHIDTRRRWTLYILFTESQMSSDFVKWYNVAHDDGYILTLSLTSAGHYFTALRPTTCCYVCVKCKIDVYFIFSFHFEWQARQLKRTDWVWSE